MAILISRNPQEVNLHQHQNGLEWSRNEQNRLAGSLEASQARAHLRNEIGVFQVERGDTLGAIAQGLSGTINWSQRVDYRSNRVSPNKPTTLSDANLIYPGQYVWVEQGALIVADALPTNTTTVGPSSPAPVTSPVAPAPGIIPAAVPAVVPNNRWRATIAPPQITNFRSLPTAAQTAINDVSPSLIGVRFETSNFTTTAVPSNIASMLAIANRSITVPNRIPFLISRNTDIGSQGAHLTSRRPYSATTDAGGNIAAVNPGASNTAVILNLSGGPNSIEPPRTNTEEFGDVLLNEFSHTVTSQLLDEYIVRRTRGLVGTSVFNAPREEDLEREFMAGFTHPDIPGGLYNFSSYDELQSDAFSMSVSPEGIMGRYLIYGRTPLNPTSYDLNRDFTAHHLAEFLRINGHGNYSMSQVNQAFRRYYNAFNVGNRSEMQRLETVFQFNNPAFFAFIQPKYQVVGEALYRHMTNKINAL